MRDLFIPVVFALLLLSCESGKSEKNYDDGDSAVPDITNDESQVLPDDEVVLPDEAVDDTADEIAADGDAVSEDPDDISGNDENEDADKVDADENNDPEPDEDDAYYALKCDCFGSDYTIPEQFRSAEGWCKKDEDSDGIPNCIEAKDGDLTNSDADSDPDFNDTDSDNDGIPDMLEGVLDTDEDGIENFRDTDSDGDGYLDSEESPSIPSRDTENDNIPDYVDFDSDNDGLLDSQEKDLGTDPLKQDSDDDGFDDLAEVEFGTDPLDDQSGIPEDDFYVKLPYNAPADETRTLKFKTSVEKVDILILFDLSDSMSEESANIKSGISAKIIDGISANITDAGFGLATFDDWKALSRYWDSTAGTNYSGTGTLQYTDTIFSLVQPITTDTLQTSAAVNALQTGSLCGWEPHQEALYQIATGDGYTGSFHFATTYVSSNKCDVVGDYIPEIPAVDCTGTEGNIGGACFRNDAMPIIIMLSDEAFTDYGAHFTWNIPYHTVEESITALNFINAKFIGIDSWDEGTFWTSAPETDFKAVSTGTGSVSATTGEPFFYKIASDGTGLSDQISDAVLELTSNIKLDVRTDKMSVSNPELVDTSLFIKSMTPDSSDPLSAYLSKDTTTFYKVSPGAKVNFEIKFYNDFYEPDKAEATVFRAKINVLGDGALLDTREVVILVPGIHSRDAED